MITALLIDDDKHLRTGLKALLERYTNDIFIVGEAESVKTGIAHPYCLCLAYHKSYAATSFNGTKITSLDSLEGSFPRTNSRVESSVISSPSTFLPSCGNPFFGQAFSLQSTNQFYAHYLSGIGICGGWDRKIFGSPWVLLVLGARGDNEFLSIWMGEPISFV